MGGGGSHTSLGKAWVRIAIISPHQQRVNLRDLLGKFMRCDPLEIGLCEIPYMQPVCSVWKWEVKQWVKPAISTDGLPRHISLLDVWAKSRNLIGDSEALIRSCIPFEPINQTTPARVPSRAWEFERGGSDRLTPREAYRLQAIQSRGQKPGRRYRAHIRVLTVFPE
jgi:hypothetical protein